MTSKLFLLRNSVLAVAVFGLLMSIEAGANQKLDSNKKPNEQQRSARMNATSQTNLKDYQAVKAALGLYIEAGKQAKSSIMKPAFHPQAVMYGHVDGKLVGGPIQSLYDIIDKGPAAKNLKAEVTKVEIVGQIAQAQVESTDWNGASYTDMFQLVKDGDDWKILVKEYHIH